MKFAVLIFLLFICACIARYCIQHGNGVITIITEKYRPEPGIEPRASRLTYERSTTELSMANAVSKPVPIIGFV